MKKLIIAKMPVKDKEAVVTMLLTDGRPVEFYVDSCREKTRAGDIYVGHTERVMEKSGGAFVKYKEGETGFLPAGRMRSPVFCNAKKDNVLKAGDELIVRVETEQRANKQAVLNTALKGARDFVSEITEKGKHRPWGTCLFRAPAPYEYLYTRYRNEGFERVVTDVPEAAESIGKEAYLYEDQMLPLYRLYGMSAILDGFLQKKVWLPGGGYLAIEQTEAFVCVDVNSAKAAMGKSTEETNLSVDLEALAETARQIRCRGLSGTILIDLIPLKEDHYKEELLSCFTQLAAGDSVYTNAVDITPLYIMEITRHKVKKSLKEQIAEL